MVGYLLDCTESGETYTRSTGSETCNDLYDYVAYATYITEQCIEAVENYFDKLKEKFAWKIISQRIIKLPKLIIPKHIEFRIRSSC